ncbi:hypothetical protein Plhal304r1_c005g0020791 [Plasmopara halstedii]
MIPMLTPRGTKRYAYSLMTHQAFMQYFLFGGTLQICRGHLRVQQLFTEANVFDRSLCSQRYTLVKAPRNTGQRQRSMCGKLI